MISARSEINSRIQTEAYLSNKYAVSDNILLFSVPVTGRNRTGTGEEDHLGDAYWGTIFILKRKKLPGVVVFTREVGVL